MRPLRLSLVGTVILVLVGGLTGASTLAQSPSPLDQGDEDVPVWVTLLVKGTPRAEGYGGSYEPGVGFAKTVRDFPVAWDATYSDARLDGTQHFLANEDCYEDGLCVAWGPVWVDGPEGTTWTGWYHEIDDADTDGVDDTSWHLVLTGTGPNEGLTAILFSLGVWEQFPNEYGVIYRGDPPGVISDPIKAVVAEQDASAGSYVIPMLRVVSGTDVSSDVLTDLAQLKGRRAVVDIPAGTPITPNLIEPPPDE